MSTVDQQFVVKVKAISVQPPSTVPSALNWKNIGIAAAVILSLLGIGVLATKKEEGKAR